MRLIDADALKKALEEMKIIIDEDVFECSSIHEELVYLLEKVDGVLAEKIDDLPTIEARPVVHGEWIPRFGSYYCSVCDEENYHAFNWVTGRYEDLYCPKCGADMRTEEN